MLKKNTYHKVTVTDMNDLGYGVARVDGIVVFVDGGVTGDELEIKIIKAAKDYGVARIEKIITPSNHRVSPDCAVFPRCGGCTFRHVSREYELKLKRELVVSAFHKNGVDATVNEVVTDGNVSGYRNKAQYPIDENGNIGYYARHSHTVIPCDRCDLTAPQLSEIASFVSDYIKIKKWSVKHIYLRIAEKTGQIMTCLVTPNEALDGEKEFAEALTTRFPNVVSVILNIHPEETNVILGKKIKVLYGTDRIEDILCECKFGISSLSFYQVNRSCAELLYNEAIKRAGDAKKVADLYCGAGTIGISFAKSRPDASVLGIEIIPQAVENAKQNAALNGIKNATFICADAMTAPLDGFDCIFVDPPRKGLSRELVDRMCRLAPKKIVYVSCDPSTLARDAKILVDSGYEMGTVTPVDMFPRTGHVETVVCLSRQIDVHKMKLNSAPFEMIKRGEKTIELRLFDEKRRQIKVGDKIVFTNTLNGETLEKTAVKLHHFDSFEELYKSLPLLKCGYTVNDIDNAKPSDMEQYYSRGEQKKYGVVGIELY
ncbi:MAG: 23S rRNA (uracil(1939)-C(5))-methyltransferase RlmD [Clostridia bacterium]|nr:23S rRNA (uracil(1939)-C(5))-methyltransferase RlmD [Clostridia bacterium]